VIFKADRKSLRTHAISYGSVRDVYGLESVILLCSRSRNSLAMYVIRRYMWDTRGLVLHQRIRLRCCGQDIVRPVDQSETEWKLFRTGKVAATLWTVDLIAWYGVMLCERESQEMQLLKKPQQLYTACEKIPECPGNKWGERYQCRRAAAECVPLPRLIHEGAWDSLFIAGILSKHLHTRYGASHHLAEGYATDLKQYPSHCCTS
jgi:hypothetical protein